ncbi:MAG: hypothetical protein ACRDEA_01350 [Microcystaceae cyanobacterium]
MFATTELNETICSIRHAFQHSNWTRLKPETRNCILWDTQKILELEELDEEIKEVIREERQAALTLIREKIEKIIDF